MRIEIDVSDMVRVAARLERFPERMAQTTVNIINDVGEQLVDETRTELAEATGLPPQAATSFVTGTRATLADKTYQMRIAGEAFEAEITSGQVQVREFEQRDRSLFEQEALFHSVSAHDDKVCDICRRIEAEGPYTLREIEQLRLEHRHYLEKNSACRCNLMPFKAARPFPASVQRTGIQATQLELKVGMTLKQLAEQIVKAVRDELT